MNRRDLLTYAPVAAAGVALGGAAVAEAAVPEDPKERIRRLALELQATLNGMGEEYAFVICGPKSPRCFLGTGFGAGGRGLENWDIS